MKFRIRFADQLVGIFLLVAILGIAVILVFVGINQRWFARNYYFRSRFESAGGLTVGMPIMLKGFEIGKVTRVSLNADNQVDIEFSVQDTYYPKVLPDSMLELTSSPFGLGVTLKFHPGANQLPPQPELSFIPSLDLPEGQRLVAEGKVAIPKGEDVIGSVISKVNPILDEVRSSLAQIRRVVASVDAALQGTGGPAGELVMNLKGTPQRINSLVDDVNARVAAISDRVNGILGRIDEVSTNLQDITKSTQGTLASLSTDLATITGNVKTTTEGLKDTKGLVKRLLDPQGSVATLLDDDNKVFGEIEGALAKAGEAVNGLNGIVAQIRSFVDFVNGTRPQISGLLETGRTTLEKGNDVLEAVKNNPLLKGGVPAPKEQGATLKSYRDEDF